MNRILILFSLLFFSLYAFGQTSWEIRLMPQAAIGVKNIVQRPNTAEGTRVFLNEEFSRVNSAAFSPRVEVEFTWKKNHFILTGTWLKDKFEGRSPKVIQFNDVTFDLGVDLRTNYRFNTYRATYRYGLVEKKKFDFELGATLLLRDAEITMYDDDQRTDYNNVGVAPLLSYLVAWHPNEKLSLISYGDGFAIGAGRAFDIYAGVKYKLSDELSASFGYRLLEGGSDVDKIYTMALYNFISLGIGYTF